MSDTETDADAGREATQSEANTITVYSDYVCPFCYLGRESLTQYQETRADPLRIDWHPYDLRSDKRGPDGDIDHDADDGKDEDYYEQARENVRRLQDEYGVEMTDELRTDVDSLPAQVVSYFLRERGDYDDWLAFDRGVFDALWVDGRDIGERAVLEDVAEDAGLDPGVVAEALDDDELREQVTDLFDRARRQRVTGVPTFVYGEHAARGAVPPEHLRRLVEGN
jgi:predicted DsbA family dithiol-disulfide isomerase